jgi:hypothetical protein
LNLPAILLSVEGMEVDSSSVLAMTLGVDGYAANTVLLE